MFFKQTFKIFFDDGTVVETDNILSWIENFFPGGVEAFYYRMKWLCKYDKKPLWYYSRANQNEYYKTFHLYTKNNLMISPELFRGEFIKYKEDNLRIWKGKHYYSRKQWRHNHCRKPHSTTYDRRMETFAERRAIAGVVKEEGEPEFRGRRRNVPQPWDDIIARRSLSWKDCTKRKRQHKGS